MARCSHARCSLDAGPNGTCAYHEDSAIDRLPLYGRRLAKLGNETFDDYMSAEVGALDDEIRLAKARLARYVEREATTADAAVTIGQRADGSAVTVSVREVVDRMLGQVAKLERIRAEVLKTEKEDVAREVTFVLKCEPGVGLEDS